MIDWLENLHFAMLENILEKQEIENKASYFDFKESPRQVLEGISDLYPLKSTVKKALKLFEDEDPNTKLLINLVKNDPCLCARVLKVANSSLFLNERLVCNVHDATMTLGYKTLKSVILASCLVNKDRKETAEEREAAVVSISVAKTAFFLAQQLKKKYQDETYILGLMHNLGDFLRLQGQITEKVPVELISSLVARKWNFPEDICVILMRYDNPLKEKYRNPMEEQAALIHLAREIVAGKSSEKSLKDGILSFGEGINRATFLAREILGFCDLD